MSTTTLKPAHPEPTHPGLAAPLADAGWQIAGLIAGLCSSSSASTPALRPA